MQEMQRAVSPERWAPLTIMEIISNPKSTAEYSAYTEYNVLFTKPWQVWPRQCVAFHMTYWTKIF